MNHASVILAGKRDSRRESSDFSENVVVAETSYQMLGLLSFCAESGGGLTSFNKDNLCEQCC